MSSKPNIVLITIDTLRPDHLGCYGYPVDTSPNLDRLATRGIVFKQAITNGSYTKPAFPAILSSTYGSMYGGPFADVGRQRPMLATILRGYGYRTAGFTANPLLGANVGYHEGFDTFEEPVPPAEDRWLLRVKGAQRLMRSPAINGALMRLGMETRPHPVCVGAEEITEMACNWLEKQDRPFFLWVHYMDAHWPYHIHDSLRTGRERALAWTDLQAMWGARGLHPGDAMLERVQRLYDSGIRFADQQIGCLLHRLDERGITSETAIIFTSDHGEAFYEHGKVGHGALYNFHEEIVRVPLIISLPGETGVRCCARQVSLLDIAPTVLQLVGIAIDPQMEGQSLLPAATSGVEVSDQVVVIEMVDLNWLCCAIRTEEYKYIYDERRPDHRELYALRDDPGEVQNVYGQLPDVEQQFETLLQRHLERVSNTGCRDDTGEWQADSDVVRRLRALGYIE